MRQRVKQIGMVIAALMVGFVPLLAVRTTSADPTITQYYITTGYSNSNSPYVIVNAPDGALWFSNPNANSVGRVSTDGTFSSYPVPAQGITVGPDNNLWIAGNNQIVQMATDGSVLNSYTVPDSYAFYGQQIGAQPFRITAGSDGALWFTDRGPNKIGRITTAGNITEYSIPVNSAAPGNITLGSDGDVWFTEQSNEGDNYYVGKVTPSGTITMYALPTYTIVAGLTAGPDGAMWLTESVRYSNASSIARMTTDGTVTNQYQLDTTSFPNQITTGPDGALWFTQSNVGNPNYSGAISRITTNGSISTYPITGVFGPSAYGITTGPDGALWFTESQQNRIGRITTPAPAAPTNLAATSPTLQPSLTWDAVSGASSYNVYRDGVLLASSTTNSYTDTTASVGSHSYYVTAVNSAGESGPSNTMSVTVGTAPVITSPSAATINARDQANVTVTTSGSPTAAITESGSLPTGISFTDNGNGTATFSGQASPVNNGIYIVTLTATNSLGSTSQSFSLSVNNAQTVPSFTTANSITESYNVPFSFTVNTTGNPIPNISRVSGSANLPNGVKFKDNNDGTATISGTIKGSTTSGSNTITLQAKNKNGTVTQDFTINW